MYPASLRCLLPLCLALCAAPASAARNVVLFVADGLRAGSVTAEQAPTLDALARAGTRFANSHAVSPTLTMVNGAAIATGHLPGDTGVYANTLYPGHASFDRGAFGQRQGTPLPFIEADLAMGDLDAHYEGMFLGEETLLSLARAHGYSTAAVGKLGPTGLQDVGELAPVGDRIGVPATIIIDDGTGSAESPPLDAQLLAWLDRAGLAAQAPARTPSAHAANVTQQAWMVQATTRGVLPLFRERGRPFLLVYWSRDPDGTQHGQADGPGQLVPGINGPTSLAAVRNADANLRELLAAIDADPEWRDNTDVLVTSDHGFATISRSVVDGEGHATRSAAAAARYDDVPAGQLPPGFLALDLAAHLGLAVFDPDAPAMVRAGAGGTALPGYQQVRAASATSGVAAGEGAPSQHTRAGNALLGGSGLATAGGTDARVLVAANGGVDLIYLPQRDASLLASIVAFLSRQDYVGGLFVDDSYGSVPGALPMAALGLRGAGRLPQPALLVGFRSFAAPGGVARGPLASLLNAAQVSDTPLAQGQGMHGAITRENTYNFMAARGPDIRAGFVDSLPVGNADLAPTVAALLGWDWPSRGALGGRVLDEARAAGGRAAPVHELCTAISTAGAGGRATVLAFQQAAGRLYVDEARFEAPAGGKAGTRCRRER